MTVHGIPFGPSIDDTADAAYEDWTQKRLDAMTPEQLAAEAKLTQAPFHPADVAGMLQQLFGERKS